MSGTRSGSLRVIGLSLAFSAAAISGVITPATAVAAPNNCIAGYVPREARPGDDVCVTPDVAKRTAGENATAAERREPNGGAYGPLTCKQGFVWREAFNGDGVCVTPQIREQTWADNAAAASRRAPNPGPGAPTPSGNGAGAVLGSLNQQRAGNGCPALALNAQLSSAATRHANDMLKNGLTGHSGSDGSSPEARMGAAGYTPISRSGEIVYVGFGGGATPQAAVDWWMNSPGHRAIITDCAFKDVGVSAPSADGKMTAVAVFGIR